MPTASKWLNRPKDRILRDERLKRNVVEINIDIDQKVGKIEREAVAKLFSCMGLNAGTGGDLLYYTTCCKFPRLLYYKTCCQSLKMLHYTTCCLP